MLDYLSQKMNGSPHVPKFIMADGHNGQHQPMGNISHRYALFESSTPKSSSPNVFLPCKGERQKKSHSKNSTKNVYG